MKISIVVTCFNEEKNIGACLDSLLNLDYPREKYEIIISDGGSRDITQEIVKEKMKTHPQINLVVETKKGTAAGRNAGIRAAENEYIAFIDADCEAPEEWLHTLAEVFKKSKENNPQLAAVGGRNLAPPKTSSFVKAIEAALDSYIGSFSSIQGRQFTEEVEVISLSTVNSLYEKQKLSEVGLFDETLESEAEDADLNHRLYANGNRFLFVPKSYVWHKMRSTPKNWLKNMFRYGKGRARLLKRHPDMWHISFLYPLLFILAIASTALAPVMPLFWLPILYFPFIGIFSLYQSIRKKVPTLIFHIFGIYIIQHFGYAIGEAYGLLSDKVK